MSRVGTCEYCHRDAPLTYVFIGDGEDEASPLLCRDCRDDVRYCQRKGLIAGKE